MHKILFAYFRNNNERRNATFDYYESLNVKQTYYLSMEFIQGRVMLNAIGNLKLNGPNAEALSKLGHKLEDVAC
ncbi:hypothetical protein QN277_001170 [Acacia crassicarpa]|uniref:Uncharacterized protein n=1 Tax=Acacia crassicarpa TaxID=499986 RepID=A0AAE1N6J6_9FABA|nr:hypothetical protein QN277_001170 [Acacia crassicarpa]